MLSSILCLWFWFSVWCSTLRPILYRHFFSWWLRNKNNISNSVGCIQKGLPLLFYLPFTNLLIFAQILKLVSLYTPPPGPDIMVNCQLTIAPRPVSKHASSSHNTRLVGGGVAPRGWWHIAAKLLQCLQFPAWEQPLSPAWGRLRFPAWEHLPVPCLGTFAVPAWDACQFPAWERLPVCMPCLGMLAVPAWDACQFPAWERLPVPCLGTFASALPGHVLQSLPGTLCQFPAWERLPMPCLGMFASPCLGMLFAGTLSLCTFSCLSAPLQAWYATHPSKIMIAKNHSA